MKPGQATKEENTGSRQMVDSVISNETNLIFLVAFRTIL